MQWRIALTGAIFTYTFTFKSVWGKEYSRMANSGWFDKWNTPTHILMVF